MAQHVIVNGPSKFDLMLALFENKKVTFVLGGLHCPREITFEFYVNSVKREFDDLDSWSLEAKCFNYPDSAPSVYISTEKMRYSTKNRAGLIKFYGNQ